jgi:hypothetical protein
MDKKVTMYEAIANAIYNGEFDRVIELLERYDSCYGKMNIEEAAQVARIHNAIVEAAS